MEPMETQVTMVLERVDFIYRSILSKRCSASDRSVDIIEGCSYPIGTVPCCKSTSFHSMISQVGPATIPEVCLHGQISPIADEQADRSIEEELHTQSHQVSRVSYL